MKLIAFVFFILFQGVYLLPLLSIRNSVNNNGIFSNDIVNNCINKILNLPKVDENVDAIIN